MNFRDKVYLLSSCVSAPFNSYSVAWFSEHSTQESLADKCKYNQCITQMLNSGNLTKHDRLYFRGTGIEANSLVSVINPTSAVTSKISTPVWAQYQGFSGGAARALNWNYKPSVDGVNFTRNSGCLWVYNRVNLASAVEVIIGCGGVGESSAVNIWPNVGGSLYGSVNSAGEYSFASLASRAGLLSVVRTNSTTISLYYNGIYVASVTQASEALNDQFMYELAYNINGTLSFPSVGCQVYASGISSGTINQAALYSEINGLATLFGVNV